MYVSILETSEGYFLVAHEDDKSIIAFRTKEEGLKYYEDGYNTCHTRGYESSMSACVNWMQFRPSIVEFKDIDDILKNLFERTNNFQLQSISSISGRVIAFKLDKQDNAKKLWEKGCRPQLIKIKQFEVV